MAEMNLRKLRRASILILLFIAACGISRPPLRLHSQPGIFTVDVMTLGEYQTSLSRIEVTESESGRVVWQVLASGELFQIHSFELRPGMNAAELEQGRPATQISVPRGGQPFLLQPDIKYEVKVCGGEGLKRCSERTFRFTR